MKIKLSASCPFDLDATLCCGQTFRWDKQGEWWFGVVRDKAFKIRQTTNILEYENADANFVRNYFGLDDDLPKIYKQIGKDQQTREAIKKFKGLRILRQDPWECLISYICATFKNIPAIKQMLLSLSHKFGSQACFEGQDFYGFPTPEKLAHSSVSELAACSLGYRAKYVYETARIIHKNGVDVSHFSKMDYVEAKKELLKFSGVGLKVADCVLLFSLRKLEAFPVDVWVTRVMMKYYGDNFPRKFVEKIAGKRSPSDPEYGVLNDFGREYFGEYAGYAQEYLYHFERSKC